MEKVVGLLGKMHSVNLYAARLGFLIGGGRVALRDHVHLDPLRLQLLGEIVNMRTDPAHDARRILPGKHDHAHALL